uniref:SCP domain-containing protein n=1 Tax=Mesocestoides corti TaxID=53468 RepID=A0A5K3FKM8_MESCO
MRWLIFLAVIILHVAAEVPTEEERNQITEFHTKLREEVNPPATNMMLMQYSTELEQLTQNLLANCSYRGPEANSTPAGVWPILNVTQVVKPKFIDVLTEFGNQKQFYNYDNNSCDAFCYFYKKASDSCHQNLVAGMFKRL